MKVLYGIQGTGNGHIARAAEIIPHLQKKCDLDILISGYHSELNPAFKVDYKMKGMGFTFGKNGGVDLLQSFKKLNTSEFRKEIRELPVEKYDFIINDFEPVSAWAGKNKNVPVISVSHQSALLSDKIPQPSKKSFLQKLILTKYAPHSKRYGFHFDTYEDWIFPPIIRSEIRSLQPTNLGHITVYLPAYGKETIIKVFRGFKGIKFEVFDKHSSIRETHGNVVIFPVSNEEFIRSFLSCEGVFCGAGFETPAEALFLGKKLLAIPMKNQFEQHYNAAGLKSLGVPILSRFHPTSLDEIQHWLVESKPLKIDFPDITEQIVDRVLEESIRAISVEFDQIL